MINTLTRFQKITENEIVINCHNMTAADLVALGIAIDRNCKGTYDLDSNQCFLAVKFCTGQELAELIISLHKVLEQCPITVETTITTCICPDKEIRFITLVKNFTGEIVYRSTHWESLKAAYDKNDVEDAIIDYWNNIATDYQIKDNEVIIYIEDEME